MINPINVIKNGNKFQSKVLLHKWKKISSNIKYKFYSEMRKKDFTEMMKQNPMISEVESGWYEWWEENNFFRRTEAQSKFVMLLPPPNVTGELHMGHAVTCALQDAIVRWNQMKGNNVLWIPGCDHAGIATQVVVERHLQEKMKLTRHDIGREKFVKEILKWKKEKQNKIFAQMRRMGVSLQWDQSYFTLDPNVCEGVVEAFTRLFDEGLMYRSKYMINWCCALQSAISDYEVELMDIDGPTRLSIPGHDKPIPFGYMYNIKYRLADSNETLTVSTTRPETLLGDTGIMVHPDDPRYTSFHGRKVIHPFRGDHIPIVADSHVSKDLGTGVVKVTPGHSLQDYEVGKRHDLPIIEIMDDEGRITGFEEFNDQPRFTVRETILNALASKGLLEERKPHSMQIPKCMRTGDVIERLLKDQWFLATKEMTDMALHAVDKGELRFHPPEFSKVWYNFLLNQRDWCVSRQLWWGHQIPVYWVSTREDTTYGSNDEIKEGTSIFVAASDEESALLKATSKLGVEKSSIKVTKQETDVLDTWFSSSILPFVVFGWPKESPHLKNSFPLSLMETGHDILFFWVARMVMMSLKLVGELPFNDVLLHGLVCDSKGHKMSKSKGNVLDPLHVMDGTLDGGKDEKKSLPSYGADALRFTLCSLDTKRRNITIDMGNIEQGHFFRNKMWQTFRFLLQNIEKIPDAKQCMESVGDKRINCVMDKWLLSQLARMVSESHKGFTTYDVYLAAQAVRTFWTSFLCDVYLEACKPRLWSHSTCPDSARECLLVLWSSLHTSILTLSPFMPFLSEELYGHLPSRYPKLESITQCSFPSPDEWNKFRDVELESQMDTILEAISAFRYLRKAYNITTKSQQGKGTICIHDLKLRETCEKIIPEMQRLSFLSEVQIQSNDFEDGGVVSGVALQPVSSGVSVKLHLQDMIDPEVENTRLSRKLMKLEKERDSFNEKLLRLEKKSVQPKESDLVKLASLGEEIKKVGLLLQNLESMK